MLTSLQAYKLTGLQVYRLNFHAWCQKVKRSHLRLSKLVASMMRAWILDLSSNDSQLLFDWYSKKIEEQSNINRKRIEYQSNIRGRINEPATMQLPAWYNWWLVRNLSSACLFSIHKYLRKKFFAANALLLAMSTLSFVHYFRPRHTVPGGRIPLLF